MELRMVVDLGNEQLRQSTRFARDLMALLERVEYRPVSFSEDIDEIYRLRYRAYRREGSVPFNSKGTCWDELDDEPNCFMFGVYVDGQLVSSLRLHHLTRKHRNSPSMTSYPDLLEPLIDQGMEFIDPSRFTADEDAAREYPTLAFLTLRIAAMASVHFEADHCLACVRPEHGAFYRRVFHSKRWGGQRPYEGLGFPVNLYAAEVANIRDRVYDRFPFFMSTRSEQRMMFERDDRQFTPLTVLPTARFALEAAGRPVAA
jgi:N-acyl-L-homoserine lactone synthetase